MNQGLSIVCQFAEVSGTSLNALIGVRVGRGVLADGWTNTTAAISIHAQSLRAHLTSTVQEDRYVIKCFGGSSNPMDAEEVFRAVFDRFQNASGNMAAGGLVIAELETASPTLEPDTNYPVYISTWRIMTS